MEDSKSYIKQLEEYGRKTGREVNTDIRRYKRMRGIGQYGEPETWFVEMQDKPSSGNYFVNYYGSNLEVGKYLTFSGVFLSVDIPRKSTLLLHQSDIFDKFNRVFGAKRIKTGYSSFDRKTILRTNDPTLAKKLFRRSALQNEIFDAYKEITGLAIGVNEIYFEYIPELKDKSNICAFIRYDWITDGQQIERLFRLGYLLREQLSNI
jgi:hypothetical protein